MLWLVLPIFVLGTGRAAAQGRELLYERESSEKLKKITGILCDQLPYARMTRSTDCFARIAPRKDILTPDNRLKEGAVLGAKPMAFSTIPDSIAGRSLLDIYQDIGYEAESILRSQRDLEMVAIVFRYADEVTLSDARDGRLPTDFDNMSIFRPGTTCSPCSIVWLREQPSSPTSGESSHHGGPSSGRLRSGTSY
jgi:hypothetical protein